MMIKFYAAICGCLVLSLLNFKAVSQVKPSLFDGMVVAGYVDKGAYVNCTGPAIKYIRKQAMVMVGLLPSLKIKEDKVLNNAPENSTITPSLGFGLTAAYKHLVLQLPLFYSAKTPTTDGKWRLGAGIGYKF